MTRRSSLRALAREIYREMAARKAAKATLSPGPLPNPPPHAGEGTESAEGGEKSLTEKVRALYEHSAVPVAEIAALAGVAERTVYKYAAKGRWRPRYRWSGEGGRPRGARWRALAPIAPVKGAGARFIRRAEAGKPVATGLKATDPAGAARALESCGAAAGLSREAQQQAEAARRSEALIHAIETTGSALRNLREFHQGRDQAKPGPFDLRAEAILFRVVTLALAQWQALVAEEERAKAGGLAQAYAPSP